MRGNEGSEMMVVRMEAPVEEKVKLVSWVTEPELEHE